MSKVRMWVNQSSVFKVFQHHFWCIWSDLSIQLDQYQNEYIWLCKFWTSIQHSFIVIDTNLWLSGEALAWYYENVANLVCIQQSAVPSCSVAQTLFSHLASLHNMLHISGPTCWLFISVLSHFFLAQKLVKTSPCRSQHIISLWQSFESLTTIKFLCSGAHWVLATVPHECLESGKRLQLL